MSAAAAAAGGPSPSSSSSSTTKKCFNSDCSDFKSRKGWRLRSGELAELCDRCASAYEEGRFCETFHLNAAGWRCCESCGKRVHCGCIVSCNAFQLLDAGGIECVGCARQNFVWASNTTWMPPFAFHERFKDNSVKKWSLAGSGPVPWRQAPSLFSSSIPHPELHPRTLYEIGRPNTDERSPGPFIKKGRIDEISERLITGSLKLATRDVLENGNAGTSNEEKPGSSLGITQQPSFLREDPFSSQRGIDMPIASLNGANGQIGVTGTPLRQPAPPLLAKQFHGNLHNGVDSSAETHIRNGRPRADARGRSQLLPRYWPRFTNEELQQISGNSNSLITPLFEKMLSASDAGRIGRLVLPKKCAEAYFPPIENPEGLPLKVQDSKGQEWIFQFRFWPNNNSRMYVLEGVTPCIQNMRLQAGDIVTFSRLEPEGKLVMGFRKASPLTEQDNDTRLTGNSVPLNGDAEMADLSPWSKVDKSGYIAREVLEGKSSIKKRKSSTLGSRNKRLRIENEDMIELKLTWEEAQGLLRPPPDHIPSVVVIEGFEFEEYEDAPILGKPTIFATDNSGCKLQWVQCEDCFKWRKLPADALLPSRWMCSANTWDPERSLCSAAQELTAEQLKDLLPSAASKKLKAAKQDIDSVEALEGLDTLLKAANLAILEENDGLPTSSQATTKHPRHRPGCSCIVCIQPPSGKGPKHKQTCTCNVCQTVKRRFKTLMMKREKKQSEKEAESTKKKPDKILDDYPSPSSNTGSGSPIKKKMVGEEGFEDDPNRNKSSTSPFKGQIDLNIQPEREEELSPGSDSGSMVKMLQDATDRYLRQQRLLSSVSENSSAGKQTQAGNAVSEIVNNNSNNIMLSSSHQDTEKDHPANFSIKVPESSSAAG